MRRFSLFFAVFALISVAALSADSSKAREVSAPFVSPNIVISQIYGGGGNVAGSQFTHDFVELFNRGDQPVSLNGWSTQYASAPWADFENYCRTLASQGNEIYIITGPSGNIGTIGATPQNRVVIPAVTWKVVLVIPNGSNDVTRASSKATRVLGVIMSNQTISQSAPWRNFRVTVDAVEQLTGYNFFSAIPRSTQEIIEKRRDRL